MTDASQKKEENDINLSNNVLIKQFRKDWIIYIVCLAAVLICMMTYLNATSILKECNNNCIQQFNEKCVTGATFEPFVPVEVEPSINRSEIIWEGLK